MRRRMSGYQQSSCANRNTCNEDREVPVLEGKCRPEGDLYKSLNYKSVGCLLSKPTIAHWGVSIDSASAFSLSY